MHGASASTLGHIEALRAAVISPLQTPPTDHDPLFPSNTLGEAHWRPQGETKRVLGASFGGRCMVIVEKGERCQARTHRPRAAQVKGTTPHYGGQPAVIFKQHEK